MLPLLLYKLVCLIIFVAHFGSHFSPRSPGITSHNPCVFCSTETIQQPNVAKKSIHVVNFGATLQCTHCNVRLCQQCIDDTH